MLSPIYWGNWYTERCSNLPRMTQPGISRAMSWKQAAWLQCALHESTSGMRVAWGCGTGTLDWVRRSFWLFTVFLVTLFLVSSEADGIGAMVITRCLLWNAYNRVSWVGVWEFQGSESLLISLQASQHWSPWAVSLTCFSWKIKTHWITLSLAPRKLSWIVEKVFS